MKRKSWTKMASPFLPLLHLLPYPHPLLW